MKALEKLREYANIDFGCDMSTHQEECLEAIAELEEAMKPKTCAGCKTLPFVLTELAKKNGGKCGVCKRLLYLTKHTKC